ncbi:MAG: aspartate aminotransferase family protein [Chloroflexi bacterium]|nr:aspartate aminotransferase family protein [Chloroflexota bacterium]
MPKKRTQEEKALLEKARRYLPGGTMGNVYSPDENAFVIKRGRGSRVWDVSGNEYIDYLLGSGPMVLGHAHPAVNEAVRDYLDRGTTYFAQNEPAILLAEEIVRAVPCAERVRFTTSGTDACFQCLRLARAFRKREKILKFEGGYHGSSDYAMMSTTPALSALQEFPRATRSTPGIPTALEELVLVAPFNDAKTTVSIIERHHDELAAVIMEPLQRLIPPAPGFLQAVRDATARFGIPLVFDEVVTGFRLAYGGAQERYGVVPDLAAFGKIVGGGFPLAAIVGRAEVMDMYDPSRQGYVNQVGTLSGNPIAAVAGLATLAELRKEGVYQRWHATAHTLRQTLERLLREAEIPAQVVGDDTVFDVYFTDRPITDYRSTLSARKEPMDVFNRVLLENGVLKGSPKIYVGVCHTPEDVTQTTAAFRKAVERVVGM